MGHKLTQKMKRTLTKQTIQEIDISEYFGTP